ncbi:P22 phage major capsid protein family protein [Pseudomonas helleri]|nr:P22 phage major capsid protein family protein [Pseudomonas helleri]
MTQSNALVVLPAYGNDFEALINETILPVAMSRLRGQLTMPKLITVNKADESKKVGELIRVNKPVEFDKADEHGTGGSVATDLNVSEVELRLDRHVYKEFKMSDREFTGMQPGVIPDSLAAAVDVLARTVNEAIFDMYTEVPYFSGLLTSTNPRDKRDLIQNRKGLHNRMVLGDKNLVLTSDTEADLLGIFTSYSEQPAEKEGIIGRRFGFDTYSDVQAPFHFAGTASSSQAIKLSVAGNVGSSVLVITGAGASATFVKGDILTLAGTDQVFAVAANIAADADGAAAVTVTPSISAAIPSGTAVTVVGDHPVDLSFSKTAFLIAFRQLEAPVNTNGTTIGSLTDPDTGITLRLLSWYKPETESTHWKLETLFGTKAVAPERASRMGGH